ncbi:MAG: dehydrogenase E1 component subunit alpha/beta [Deltaproteobacteria bacterium]|nr:dehydrogenase E1 component subunit alpha/beta [Deltaproteobacteria bacterium]
MSQAQPDKRSPKSSSKDKKKLPEGLTEPALLKALQNMFLSRLLDDKMLVLLKQGKSYFHIGGMGHEAVQTAAAMVLTPGRDWAWPYYRDQALCTGLGMTADEIFLCFLAKEADPNSGGRQMPQHYGHKKWNIPTQSSPTGTQFLQATGCALASMRNHKAAHPNNGKTADYDVTIVCAGDGTTSQGDFHEALNWAAREKAPVIFLIEDNGYAISVPVTEQTPGGKVANLGRGYDNLKTVEVDGCDLPASYEVMRDAVARARTGAGPTLVVASVVRLLPHSSSDDQRKYRPEADLTRDKTRDPIPALKKLLLERNLTTELELAQLEANIKLAIDAAAEKAELAPMPARNTATKWVLSGDAEPPLTQPEVAGDGIVLVDAINRALSEEMARDAKVLVFGEDVAGEKGGVFTATRGLTAKHGVDRCFNSPLAESSIVGVSIGLSLRGYKPVPEIQFGDYIWTAMMQIRNEVSTIRYRSNNQWSCPMVLRVPIGGYIHGALCHSQNIESFFAHIPGLKIALPSSSLDAYGLLKAAIRGNDPVLFLEHKGLYRQAWCKSQLPTDPEWVLPFGKAAIRRPGNDLTVITYGALVQRALAGADTLKDEGIDCEVIDLRTLNPVDWDTLTTSVRKTGKCLVLHEDCRFVGYGAEIAAEISERCFESLDGPVRRLAGEDSPVPYNWDLEEEILPQPDDVVAAMRDLARF